MRQHRMLLFYVVYGVERYADSCSVVLLDIPPAYGTHIFSVRCEESKWGLTFLGSGEVLTFLNTLIIIQDMTC
jgi:hypothetical protein